MNAFLRFALFVCLSFSVSGCSDSSPQEGPKKLRIGMMPKLVGIPFFDACQRGAEDAARELDVDLIYDGPTEASAENQGSMVEAWVAQGFDVIAVAPNDPESISPKLARAKSSGATVMTWDTDANIARSGRLLFVNHTPNEGIANTLVDMMVAGVGEDGKLKGKFLIVSGTQTAANQNTWMSIMLPRLEQEHPECELIPTLYPGENHRETRVQTSDALATYRDLKGIWAITSVAVPAAAKAVRDAGRQDRVYLTGLSLPSLMREYVKDGTIEQFALFNVEDLGYLTVQIAHHLQEGPLLPGTYDFGRVHGVRVDEVQAILGDPVIFNRENIDDYNF